MKYRKKQVIIVSIVVVILLAAVGTGIWFMRGRSASQTSSGQAVYVSSVASIIGLNGSGMIGRYSGVVEPQQTWKIELSSEKKVKKIYVKEGDEVKIGDELFIYDTADSEEGLAQAEIDLERIDTEIDTMKRHMEDLKKEKASASAEEQLEYTTRIQTEENSIKRSEYDQKIKRAEIKQLKKSIKNAAVTSEMDGTVKSINATGDESSYMTGEAEAFMTILATGSYRIKGSVNEQNISAIVEGQPVIVHSRVDENQTWKGTLTAVDMENPKSNQNSDYFYGGESSESSSNSYPFYVELDATDGLMLGQHVYIEMDYGQEEAREGLWLDSYYIVQEDGDPYVWAANDKDKIEKRKVILGAYDEELMKYEIREGLAKEDYIAFPDASIAEGAKAEKNVENATSNNTNSIDRMDDMEYNSFDDEIDENDLDDYDESYDDEIDVYDGEIEDYGYELEPGVMEERIGGY